MHIAFSPLVARAEPTSAESASARDQLGRGRDLRTAGKLPEALVAFKAAFGLAPTPIIGIELARTYSTLGMPVEAREVCLAIARMPVSKQETSRSSEARRDAATLEDAELRKIASLIVQVVVDPPDAQTTLKIDGEIVPRAAYNLARQVNPGNHEVVLEAAGVTPVSTTVAVLTGIPKTIALKLDARIASVGPIVPDGNAPPPRLQPIATKPVYVTRTSVWVPIGGIVAGAGFVFGTVAGVVSLTKEDALKVACPNKSCAPGQATSDLSSAKLWANLSNVGFVVGGVGAVMLIVGLVSPDRELVSGEKVQSARKSMKPTLRLFLSPEMGGVYGSF